MPVASYVLSIPSADIDNLRFSVDRALNVEAARDTEALFGRPSALEALTGRKVLREALDHESVVKVRKLDVTSKRRPSGRSNLPRTKSQRAVVRDRSAKRRSAGLPPVPMAHPSPLGTALSVTEQASVTKARAALAMRLGIHEKRLSPSAACSMLVQDSKLFQERQPRLRAMVALYDATPAPEISGASRLLNAGDAVCFDAATQPLRLLAGDWRRFIWFDIFDDEVGLPPCLQ